MHKPLTMAVLDRNNESVTQHLTQPMRQGMDEEKIPGTLQVGITSWES